MATIQVILQGARVGTHDIFDYPIVLQFGEQKSYERAVWYIPSTAGRIRASRVSEIRVVVGTFSVLIDGPEGFQCGPYPVSWVRSYYPRGKECALIQLDPDSRQMSGVTLTVVEESLVVEELLLGGTTPTATA